ncbi:MAG TPA: fatty acid desaturase [Steroidobacteraceae bacterium]|nr:fatty acid desaturase [Steroidobacteraceae bacterium]
MSPSSAAGRIRDMTSTARARPAVELPTLLLLIATYAGWLTVTAEYRRWPLALVACAATVLITLHSSLQHEIVHGHPTRWRGLNRLLGIVPLSIWLPYERYRHTHHIHHVDERLTDPVDDPESFYWTAAESARLGWLRRGIIELERTLAGRVLIGSFLRIGLFLYGDLRALARDEPGVRRVWAEHLLWCIPVVFWVKWVCGIPLWLYFLAMVVPANGIQLIRSFAEHRARPAVRERVAIVERSWILGPLFLFNNLHALHHESPGIPWYECPARYRRERERLIAENGGLVYRTYFEVAWRYLFRAQDVLEHPTGRVPSVRA